jgi:papilin
LKVGPCKAAFPRYYFNPASQQCVLFSWGGCQPNLNNFLTLAECQKVCPVNPCKQALKVGPCKAAITRFYFDSVTQKCKKFSWGGCQPNLNNFLTLEECQKVCPVKVDPCTEVLKVGPCKAAFPRFYFNSVTKKCDVFWWGGCQPNGNNFETVEACEQTCPVVNKSPCLVAPKSGSCKAAFTRYYYDYNTKQCKIFTWGGCGANENNFETVEACEKVCPVQGRDPCLEPKKVEPCRAAINRFFFNSDSRNCELFSWGGCDANGNNFETIEACEASCVGTFWKQ